MTRLIDRRSFVKSLALLPLLQLGSSSNRRGASTQTAPNVLVLVFDTLSARHMSLYGYDRETTPNLARFAQRSTVYHAHYAGGNFTTPGTASLLTGLYPWSHRAFNLFGTIAQPHVHDNIFKAFASQGYSTLAYSHNPLVNMFFYQFAQDIDTLKQMRELCLLDFYHAEQLFPTDFDVAFWSEQRLLGTSDWGGDLPPSLLFLSLLERMRRAALKRKYTRDFEKSYPKGLPNLYFQYFLLEDAIDWIEAQLSSAPRPYFAYFHLLPPHEPYTPRREFIGLFDDKPVQVPQKENHWGHTFPLKALTRYRREYDEYIAYTDAEFGRLYDFMARNGVLENTYVVFTSDHGQLFERGFHGHGSEMLYEGLIHIPLIVSKPGTREREDVYAPTHAVDLLPTFLHLLGQAIPDWCEGHILPTFDVPAAGGGRTVFAVDAQRNAKNAVLTRGTVALLSDEYKLIHYFGYDGHDDRYELYDLRNDPEEMADLFSSKRSVTEELQQVLQEKLRAVNEPYLHA